MRLKYAIFLLYALLPFQVALGPSEGFDIAVVRILMPLIAFLWFVRGLKNKDLFFPRGLSLAFLLSFIFLALFSLFFAQNIFWGWRKFLFLLTLFPIYFVIAELIRNPYNRRILLNCFIYGTFGLALVAIFQFLLQFFFGLEQIQAFWAKNIISLFLGEAFSQAVLKYPSWFVNIAGQTYMRAIATFPDPHMLAFYLNMALPFSLISFLTAKKNKKFFGFVTATILIASILTFSRGGYLGLIFSLLAGGFFLFRKAFFEKNWRWLILLGLFVGLFFFINSPVKNRLFSILDTNDGSNQGRMLIWKQTLLILRQQPWGVGLGNYPLEVMPTAQYRDPIYAHNLYLDIAVEIGLLGLLCWIGFLLSGLYVFWLNRKSDPFAIAAIMSILAFSVHALVENPLFSVHVFSLIMLILALGSQKKYVAN